MNSYKPEIPKNAGERIALCHVRHATFGQLSATGYDVRRINDGAVPHEFEELAPNALPDGWKLPEAIIVPQAATLRNAMLFPDGSALLPDGHYCFADPSFGRSDWRRHHRPRRILRVIDPVLDDALIWIPKRKKTVTGRCFSTLTNYSSNYGHFIHDVLSRIYYEDLGVIAPDREKIVAPPFNCKIQKILFEKVFAEYEIVQTKGNEAICTEELVLPANLCSLTGINPLGIVSLHERMCRIMAPYVESVKRKVCISRRDGNRTIILGRDFVNSAMFEDRMRDMGYMVVVASELEPEAQFSLWANTIDTVGVHGAGMMNMIMMPHGLNYTEIAGAPLESNSAFVGTPNTTVRTAKAIGHKVSGIAGTLDERGQPMIDIDRLVEIMTAARAV